MDGGGAAPARSRFLPSAAHGRLDLHEIALGGRERLFLAIVQVVAALQVSDREFQAPLRGRASNLRVRDAVGRSLRPG